MKNVSLFASSTLCFAVMACSNAADPLPAASGGSGTGIAGSTPGTAGSGTAGSGTAGSDTGGTVDSGGSTSGGSDPGAGSSNGGTSQGGASGGSGGSITPAGGSGGGGAGAAGGGNVPTVTITSTDFGDFANSFLVTPCQDNGNGFDCLNNAVTNDCPASQWKYDAVQTTEARKTDTNSHDNPLLKAGRETYGALSLGNLFSPAPLRLRRSLRIAQDPAYAGWARARVRGSGDPPTTCLRHCPLGLGDGFRISRSRTNANSAVCLGAQQVPHLGKAEPEFRFAWPLSGHLSAP